MKKFTVELTETQVENLTKTLDLVLKREGLAALQVVVDLVNALSHRQEIQEPVQDQPF